MPKLKQIDNERVLEMNADMRNEFGRLLRVADVASYFGLSRTATMAFLEKAELTAYFPCEGKTKFYNSLEVARAMERMRSGG